MLSQGYHTREEILAMQRRNSLTPGRLARQNSSAVAVVFAALLVPLNVGCVKRIGYTANDNFYVIKGKGKPRSKSPYESLVMPGGSQLSASISQTLKAQAKSSPQPKTALSNAELLEKENPEFSLLLEKAKANPRSGELHFRLAKAYHSFGVYDEAQLHYQKAVQLEPENPSYYEQIGRFWRDRGAPALGVNSLQRALQLRSDFVEAWNTLGTLYDRLGDRAKAQESYLKALALNPELDYVHNNLSYSYLQDENLDEAVHHGEQAVRLNPLSSVAHNNLGIAYGMRGDLARALQEFSLVSGEAEARNNLGLVLLKRNRISESMEQFRLAAKLKPFYRTATENYYVARNLKRKQERSLRRQAREGDASRFSYNFDDASLVARVPLKDLCPEARRFLLEPDLPVPAGFQSQSASVVFEARHEVRPVVRFEIESSEGLERAGQLLGDFLRSEGYQLSRVSRSVRSPSRTIIFYRPGYSRSALELAHRIPGHQTVLQSAYLEQASEVRLRVGKDVISRLRLLPKAISSDTIDTKVSSF